MKLLIIIDMLNGFCRKGNPLSLPNSTKPIEKTIENRIKSFLDKKDEIIFVCDSHDISDPEINNPYPVHCLTGSHEAEIIDNLKSYSNKKNTIYKNTLSITLNTDLIERIEKIKPTEIEITGVCTEICVLFAVYELKIRGYNVVVNENGVQPLKPENQTIFINYMEELLGAKVKKTM